MILGSGTSNGVPMLGYVYPPGYLDDPRNRRNRACLLLKNGERNLLVDCPPEMRLMLTAEGVTDVEAVLLTHTHADHVMGMDDLRSLCMIHGRAIPVYARPEHADDVRRIFPYAFQEARPGVAVPRFEMNDVPPVLHLAGLELRTFPVEHGRTTVTAFRVNGFAYLTDVSRIPDESLPLLEGLDTLVIDAVRLRPHPNHFHLDRALETIATLRPRRAVLTHLSHDYDHGPDSEKLPAGVEFAVDGLRIAI